MNDREMKLEEGVRTAFIVDIRDLAGKTRPTSLDSTFAALDRAFLNQFKERKELIKTYRDIPLALDKLYSPDPEWTNYIRERHGKDLQITIEAGTHLNHRTANKKKLRYVSLVQDSFSA